MYVFDCGMSVVLLKNDDYYNDGMVSAA